MCVTGYFADTTLSVYLFQGYGAGAGAENGYGAKSNGKVINIYVCEMLIM